MLFALFKSKTTNRNKNYVKLPLCAFNHSSMLIKSGLSADYTHNVTIDKTS